MEEDGIGGGFEDRVRLSLWISKHLWRSSKRARVYPDASQAGIFHLQTFGHQGKLGDLESSFVEETSKVTHERAKPSTSAGTYLGHDQELGELGKPNDIVEQLRFLLVVAPSGD